MRIERIRPAVLRVDLHAVELAALVAAARWAVEDDAGSGSELSDDARQQLRDVLAGYDREVARLGDGDRPAT